MSEPFVFPSPRMLVLDPLHNEEWEFPYHPTDSASAAADFRNMKEHGHIVLSHEPDFRLGLTMRFVVGVQVLK